MAFNTIDPNLQRSEISPAQEAALMRHVGYNGPLEEASVRLSPKQKTKLTIMAKAFKSMRAGKMPIKTGDTIGVAKGGYLFAPDELNDPRVKDRMKDNPEFSEFAVDQQNATANRMQQRFAQPQDRMRQQPVRGYAQGGDGFNQDSDTDSEIAQEKAALARQKAADDARLAAQQQPPTPPVAPPTVQPRPPEIDLPGKFITDNMKGLFEAPKTPGGISNSQTDGTNLKINEPQATLPGGLMQPLAPNMYNNPPPFPPSPPSKRPANVPDWMIPNPDFDPMGKYATVMRTYTNPETGETYDGTGAGQYMVDPKIGKDATRNDVTTNNYGSQMSGPAPGIRTEETYRAAQGPQYNPNLSNEDNMKAGVRFDANGFYGDPKRLRQDLYFNTETGTYEGFGKIIDSPTLGQPPRFSISPPRTDGPPTPGLVGGSIAAWEKPENRGGTDPILQGYFKSDFHTQKGDYRPKPGEKPWSGYYDGMEISGGSLAERADFHRYLDSIGRSDLYAKPDVVKPNPSQTWTPGQNLSNITKDPDPRPKVDGTLGTPIDRPLSVSYQQRVDSGDMIDGRTFTPAELEQVKVSSGTMRGGMGTFHNMKLNGKSIILTTEQRRALIATNSAKQKEFADSQGLLQLAPIEPKQTLPTSTNVLPSFYESPEWKTFSSSPQVGTQDMYGSPYFGTRGSGSLGKQEDRAYEAFLNRTGNTSMLRGGADYVAPPPEVYPETKGPPLPNGDTMPPVNPNVPAPEAVDTRTPVQKLAADQATTMANVYSDPSKVVTPATVVSTPTGPDTTIAGGTGSVSSTAPSVAIPGATGVTTATAPAVEGPKGVMSTSNVTPTVKAATDAMTAASGSVGANSKVIAATDETSAVSNLKTTQGTATLVTNPVQRKIEAGEIISGAANATTAAAFTEQVQAATALPSVKATVQGQLATLMDDFADGKSPVWAAGAMRAANAAMAARGLGASSMAGQAIIQAAMESALPIAQADAQVTAQFEAQNLSNRQQRAMLAAEQRATFMGMEFTQEFQARVQNSARIGDIANMNFTAEQQIALENGRAANTMNLANLSNTQALLLSEAAALSNLDMSNLNNRQQAAVQNAQNFMQMDMQNLSNAQQTSMFKQQSVIQSLFTDQAATNAASQFNATSENQTQQFFASLANQTQQFNATQTNAMSQFDAENVSTLKRFNSELDNQRDQFNAKNALVIAQANTQWRQNIATIDTAAQNQANMETAKLINGLTATSIDQIWQRERDLMSFAFTASESAADRAVQVAIQKLSGEQKAELQDNIGKGSLLGTLFTGIVNKYLPLPRTN